MKSLKVVVLVLIIFCCISDGNAQSPVISREDNSSINLIQSNNPSRTSEKIFFRPGCMNLLPPVMFGFALASLSNEELVERNNYLREELWTENPHREIHTDNYLQFMPAAAVYGLNLAGVHGEHTFKDRTILLATTSILTGSIVYSLKNIVHEKRPDGTGNNSFPSGHTATAFMSAEFFRQEYKDVNPVLSYAGYPVAIATGYMRMYNNRHWERDIVAGAAVGMICTQLSYYAFSKIINHKRNNTVSEIIY